LLCAVLIAEKVGVVGDGGSGGNSGTECQITGILLNLWFCFHKRAGMVYLVWWARQASKMIVQFLAGTENIPVTKNLSLAMEPTHSSVQWYVGLFSKR